LVQVVAPLALMALPTVSAFCFAVLDSQIVALANKVPMVPLVNLAPTVNPVTTGDLVVPAPMERTQLLATTEGSTLSSAHVRHALDQPDHKDQKAPLAQLAILALLELMDPLVPLVILDQQDLPVRLEDLDQRDRLVMMVALLLAEHQPDQLVVQEKTAALAVQEKEAEMEILELTEEPETLEIPAIQANLEDLVDQVKEELTDPTGPKAAVTNVLQLVWPLATKLFAPRLEVEEVYKDHPRSLHFSSTTVYLDIFNFVYY